jgi:hypothetical protein
MIFIYHLIENPFGGKASSGVELKEVIKTIICGNTITSIPPMVKP